MEILLGGESVSKSTPLVVELHDSRFTLCAIVVLRSRLASQISPPIPSTYDDNITKTVRFPSCLPLSTSSASLSFSLYRQG